MIESIDEPTQAGEMACFRADLCLRSLESHTLEEKRGICNEMVSTSEAVFDAMRADFELPPEARSKLLDMLCWPGVEGPQWWRDALGVKAIRSTASWSR